MWLRIETTFALTACGLNCGVPLYNLHMYLKRCKTVMNVYQELTILVKMLHSGDTSGWLLCIVHVWKYSRLLCFVFPKLRKQNNTKSGWYVVCWQNHWGWLILCAALTWNYLLWRCTQFDYGIILVYIACWRCDDSRTIYDLQLLYDLSSQMPRDM